MHCWHDYQMKNRSKSYPKLHSIIKENVCFLYFVFDGHVKIINKSHKNMWKDILSQK